MYKARDNTQADMDYFSRTPAEHKDETPGTATTSSKEIPLNECKPSILKYETLSPFIDHANPARTVSGSERC